jgi:hypothetical protein
MYCPSVQLDGGFAIQAETCSGWNKNNRHRQTRVVSPESETCDGFVAETFRGISNTPQKHGNRRL